MWAEPAQPRCSHPHPHCCSPCQAVSHDHYYYYYYFTQGKWCSLLPHVHTHTHTEGTALSGGYRPTGATKVRRRTEKGLTAAHRLPLCIAAVAQPQGEGHQKLSNAVRPQLVPPLPQKSQPRSPPGSPTAAQCRCARSARPQRVKAASPDCEFSAGLPHAAKQQLDIFHPSRERQRREDIPMIPFCMPNYELRCSSICPGPASST